MTCISCAILGAIVLLTNAYLFPDSNTEKPNESEDEEPEEHENKKKVIEVSFIFTLVLEKARKS